MGQQSEIITEIEGMLDTERIKRARIDAEKEIFKIKLSNLRQSMGIKQTDIKNYSQSGISKIENRNDIKISTLISYLDNIGMRLEIKAKPRRKSKDSNKEYTLLKT